jgi:nucleoside-diphosphate-sugar epimerase
MKRYLVTGGKGFIGSYIVKDLIKKGHEVVIFDMKDGKSDIRKLENLIKSSKDCDGIFHLAAIASIPYSIENPKQTFDVNFGGTLNVLEAARINKIKRVVFSSSSAVYGVQKKFPARETDPCNPQNPYAIQKYMSEGICKMYSSLYGVETVCLRYFNVFGIGQSCQGAYAGVIPRFLLFKSKGEPLTIVGDGKQTRDFIHVTDVAKANLKAMFGPKSLSGQAFNIGSGVETSVNEIADIFDGVKKYVPARMEVRRSLSDSGRAKKILKWVPVVKFEKGLLKIIKSL